MAISVFFVQCVARYFGTAVHAESLVFCAVLSLVVNFSAILLSSCLTLNLWMVLIAMVLVSAGLATGLDEFLLQRGYVRALFFDMKSGNMAIHVPSGAGAEPRAEFAGWPQAAGTTVPDAGVLSKEHILREVTSPLKAGVWEQGNASTEELKSIVAQEQAAPATEKPTPALAPVAETLGQEPKPKETPAVWETAAESALVAGVSEQEPEFGEIPDVWGQALGSAPVTKAWESRFVAQNEETGAMPERAVQGEYPFSSVLDHLATLDDYLDYAYAEKGADRDTAAAVIYQKAIENFADDPYIPFLFIELGNLYKKNGAYEIAVRTYRDALSLPIIQGQVGIAEGFRKNIAYLDAVSHIVSRHDAPKIPFSQIPPDWIAEIEAEFTKQTGN